MYIKCKSHFFFRYILLHGKHFIKCTVLIWLFSKKKMLIRLCVNFFTCIFFIYFWPTNISNPDGVNVPLYTEKQKCKRVLFIVINIYFWNTQQEYNIIMLVFGTDFLHTGLSKWYFNKNMSMWYLWQDIFPSMKFITFSWVLI